MKSYRNETHEFLDNLSDEDFYHLLEDAGFDLEPGEGKIIFTEEDVPVSRNIAQRISYDYYAEKELHTNSILENITIKKEKYQTNLTFKNMKRKFSSERYGVA